MPAGQLLDSPDTMARRLGEKLAMPRGLAHQRADRRGQRHRRRLRSGLDRPFTASSPEVAGQWQFTLAGPRAASSATARRMSAASGARARAATACSQAGACRRAGDAFCCPAPARSTRRWAFSAAITESLTLTPIPSCRARRRPLNPFTRRCHGDCLPWPRCWPPRPAHCAGRVRAGRCAGRADGRVRVQVRGPRGRQNDSREWRVLRSASLTSELAAAKPTELSSVNAPDAAQTAKTAARRRPGARRSPRTWAPRPRGCRPRRRSAATTRPACRNSRCSWPPPAARPKNRPSAWRETGEALKPGALRYQLWKATLQKGSYSVSGDVRIVHADPICMSLPARALPPQRGASRQRRALVPAGSPDRSRRLRHAGWMRRRTR